MRARLIFQRGGREETRPLEAAELTIGRTPTCDLAIDVPGISGVHCRLQLRDGAWWAEDPGSTNGLSISGRPVAVGVPTRIDDGARLTFGDEASPLFEARFELSKPAPAPEPPARIKAETRPETKPEAEPALRKEIAELRAELALREAAAAKELRQVQTEVVRVSELLRATGTELAELRTVHGGARDDLIAAREKIVQLEATLDAQRLNAKRAYEDIDQHYRKAAKELAVVSAELEVAHRELARTTAGLEDCKQENERLVAQLIRD